MQHGYRVFLFTFLVCVSHFACLSGRAQEADPSNNDTDPEIEALYDRDDAVTTQRRRNQPKPEEPAPLPEATTLSDLAKLAPFEDVAVIQRRFLPKSNRFEFSASGFTNLNNPFFTNLGGQATLAYYLREKWALQLMANVQTTTSREVTDNLESNRTIRTDNIVGAEAFYGAAIKWNPIYGKITWLNKSIVPFDINFSLGGGMTQTTAGQSEPTIHFGTSQVFAWTKSAAFRWDLTWNTYQASYKTVSGGTEKLHQNDLFLGLGMSFYFPGATYR